MKNLSDEDSWTLFCVYAFPDGVGSRVLKDMEKEGRKIVKQCGNLPLSIKTIAASLANTTLLSKWELKRRQLERVVTPIGDPDPIMEILKLSYDSLFAHLKPCFACLSFFSEDEEIFANYLINLWIGEGFIPGAGEDQWDMGWDWLDQLAQLCLVQVYEGHGRFYSKKYCKVHDLLYDLATHISEEDKSVFSVEEVSSHTSGAMGWSRILLAKKDLHDLAISEIHPVYLRTLTLSHNEKITSIPESLFTTMRGLRILDLSSTNITALPASLGKMILLKLLNLSGTKIREVPECVRHMKSLLFLALPHYCTQLPVWISELRCLQHLECWDIDRMPKGISKLASLRTLRSDSLQFSIEEDEFMSLDDLVDMTQLQELFLIIKHEIELKRLEEGILAQLVKMRHLDIRDNTWSASEKEMELPQFPEKMRAMKHLESLTLEGFVVPSWICELANMRELELSRFEFSDFPEFQRMPNLVMLVLELNQKCREFPLAFGESRGFPQLRILKIYSFSSLEEFPELEDGAMACLQQFNLWFCPKVKKVEGLERLKNLERFHYYDSGGTNEWWETLKEGGEYWNKIKAINSHVTITIAY
ncbi:putative disease resistance protein RGA3 [Cryptomeria japonica]|uniref:putative disease resistance protein RGA3 n=1 Tax=Cryptomeria japonica TaxID=3369 RepID=UPI0027DA93E2|nr:putative disease resistance protein RGA3 [Cryptomeria japonica]